MSVCGKQWGMCGKCGGEWGFIKHNPPQRYKSEKNKPL